MVKLLLLNFKVSCYRILEWIRVVFLYYPRFLLTDLKLASQYLIHNPYKLCKLDYGETPLTTLDKIASECRILSKDTVIELGCGTGRTCFWLRSFVKCKVVGVDLLAPFIEKACSVRSDVEFRQEDILTTELNGTVIYFYGTSFSDDFIKKLCEKCASLPQKTRFITVSYPLSDYNSRFRTLKEFEGRFPWGRTSIYLSQLC
ncbi:MAG: class I SAM-dependent methyltransferase [Chlamydiales bacterium]|nr:class I SAM-dependent methyltransferase [Chlamydiales bacterium]